MAEERLIAESVCWYCGGEAEYVEPDRYGDRPICFNHAAANTKVERPVTLLIDGSGDGGSMEP